MSVYLGSTPFVVNNPMATGAGNGYLSYTSGVTANKPAAAAKPKAASSPVSSPTDVVAPTAAAPAPVAQWVDPYASTPFGSTANFNKVQGDWTAQKDSTLGSINDRIGNDALGYNSSILDYGDSATAGRREITESRVQNELAKQQGSQGILDMVGRGIKSAGTVLANKPGASNSSAAEAVGAAYGDIGQREMGKVGNQFAQAEHATDLNELSFDEQMQQGARHLTENKTKIINGIIGDAQTAISGLNSAAATASLPDRLNIEAEKDRIRNEATAKLQTYDAKLAEIQGSTGKTNADTIRSQATALMNAGQAATNPFDYTTSSPAAFAGTGPFNSELPLFSLPKKTEG